MGREKRTEQSPLQERAAVLALKHYNKNPPKAHLAGEVTYALFDRLGGGRGMRVCRRKLGTDSLRAGTKAEE